MQALAIAPAQTTTPTLALESVEDIAVGRARSHAGAALVVRYPSAEVRRNLDLDTYIHGFEADDATLTAIVTFNGGNEELGEFCFDWLQVRLSNLDGIDLRGLHVGFADQTGIIATLQRF